MMLPRAFGSTVFCDDIRQEVGGKLSLMGCYQDEMVVPQPFPFTLFRVAMLVQLNVRADQSIRNVRFKVQLPGEGVPALELPPIPLMLEGSRLSHAGAQPTNENQVRTITQQIILGPLVLETEGSFRVRAMCDDEEVRLGSLRVVHGPDIVSAPAG